MLPCREQLYRAPQSHNRTPFEDSGTCHPRYPVQHSSCACQPDPNDQVRRAGARDFPVQNRVIRPLRWTDWFATVAECSHGRQAGRRVQCTTKHTKHTKVSEKEAFDAMLWFRPEVPVNRDRTTAHSIRQNVEFHLRDLRVLRGCSNGVRWSTP